MNADWIYEAWEAESGFFGLCAEENARPKMAKNTTRRAESKLSRYLKNRSSRI